MYSMVLLASLATAGDAPAFGKHKAGGCTGVPAGCTGVVVAAPTGCYGSTAAPAPKAGFLGCCKKHKAAAGCTGVAAPAPACCAPVAVAAPAPVVVVPAPSGCYGGGGMAVPAGCTGTPAKAGFLGLCKKKAGCHG